MDDAAFMDALDHGVPAPLELYRRAYATVGVPWPGDDEVRRRHLVTDTDPRPAAVARLAAALGWGEVPEFSEQEQQELDAEFEAAQAQARRFYGLDGPVRPTAGTVRELRVAVTGLAAVVAEVRNNVTQLQRDVKRLRQDMEWLKQAVQALLDLRGSNVELDEILEATTATAGTPPGPGVRSGR